MEVRKLVLNIANEVILKDLGMTCCFNGKSTKCRGENVLRGKCSESSSQYLLMLADNHSNDNLKTNVLRNPC